MSTSGFMCAEVHANMVSHPAAFVKCACGHAYLTHRSRE